MYEKLFMVIRVAKCLGHARGRKDSREPDNMTLECARVYLPERPMHP